MFFHKEKQKKGAFYPFPCLALEKKQQGLSVVCKKWTILWGMSRYSMGWGKIFNPPSVPLSDPIYNLDGFILWASQWSKKPWSRSLFEKWLQQSDFKNIVKWGGANFHYSRILMAREFLSYNERQHFAPSRSTWDDDIDLNLSLQADYDQEGNVELTSSLNEKDGSEQLREKSLKDNETKPDALAPFVNSPHSFSIPSHSYLSEQDPDPEIKQAERKAVESKIEINNGHHHGNHMTAAAKKDVEDFQSTVVIPAFIKRPVPADTPKASPLHSSIILSEPEISQHRKFEQPVPQNPQPKNQMDEVQAEDVQKNHLQSRAEESYVSPMLRRQEKPNWLEKEKKENAQAGIRMPASSVSSIQSQPAVVLRNATSAPISPPETPKTMTSVSDDDVSIFLDDSFLVDDPITLMEETIDNPIDGYNLDTPSK